MNTQTHDLNRDNIADFLGDLIERRGVESYLGEAVSMRAHMLQAAHLAELDAAPDELIVAALLHDIGHYTNEFGDDYIERGVDNRHEIAGARVLENFFSDAVVQPVKMHVDAKRYLCATDASYAAKLSPASSKTLMLQGGAMQSDEARAFERRAFFAEALRVRRYDDAAKDPTRSTPDVAHYLRYVRAVLAR